MTEWIITSCVIMLIVICLRGILQGKISAKLQYALWAVVLVRLMIPVSLFESNYSVMNILPEDTISRVQIQMETPVISGNPGYSQQDSQSSNPEQVKPNTNTVKPETNTSKPSTQTGNTQQNESLNNRPAYQPNNQPNNQTTQVPAATEHNLMDLLSWKHILILVWAAGSVVMATALLWSNISLDRKLKSNRRRTRVTRKLPSYVTNQVATPCLFGLKRPVIYLTAETEDEKIMSHVLAHELTHYKHKDHIWSALRCVCLCLHWYNPLVWLCAVLSKKDAELACDEDTIRSLGEEERLSYGETLIRMTCARRESRDLLLTATTMNLGKKTLRDRVRMIAKNPRTAAITMVIVILVMTVAVGCTYSGTAGTPEETTPPTEPTEIADDTEPTEYEDLNEPVQETEPSVQMNGDKYYTDDGYCVVSEELYDDELSAKLDSEEECYKYFKLTGLDPNGDIIWTHESEHTYIGEGTGGFQFLDLKDGIIYYLAKEIVAVDAKTGETLWTDSTCEWSFVGHTFDQNGNLCLSDPHELVLLVLDRQGNVIRRIDNSYSHGRGYDKIECVDGEIRIYIDIGRPDYYFTVDSWVPELSNMETVFPLGMSEEDFLKQAKEVGLEISGKGISAEYNLYDYSPYNYDIHFYFSGSLELVFYDNRDYSIPTEAGLYIGDSVDRMIEIYGAPDYSLNSDYVESYYEYHIGNGHLKIFCHNYYVREWMFDVHSIFESRIAEELLIGMSENDFLKKAEQIGLDLNEKLFQEANGTDYYRASNYDISFEIGEDKLTKISCQDSVIPTSADGIYIGYHVDDIPRLFGTGYVKDVEGYPVYQYHIDDYYVNFFYENDLVTSWSISAYPNINND